MSLQTKIQGFRDIMQFDNRLYLLVCRLFYPQKTSLIYRFKGLEFETDHAAGDANGAREVLTSPMYREHLASMSFDGPVNVLDIGGNNGGFPLLLASEGYEIKRVVSIEVNPKTFNRLNANLKRNFGDRSEALNLAVCGEERNIEFTEGPTSVSDNIYATPGKDKASTTVPGQTFDSVVATAFGDEVIDICKIDIEGAEFEIFASKSHSRIAQCRYVIMEIHHEPGRERTSVIRQMISNGFTEINGQVKVGNKHFVHVFANTREI